MPRPQNNKIGLSVASDKKKKESNQAGGYGNPDKRKYKMWQAGNVGRPLSFDQWKKAYGNK